MDEVEHHIWDYTYIYLHKARYFDQFCLTIFNGKRECDKRDRVWIYKEKRLNRKIEVEWTRINWERD